MLQASKTVAQAAAELEIDLSDATVAGIDELEEPLVMLKCRNAGEPPPQIMIWDQIKVMWEDPGMRKAFDVLLSPDPPEVLKEFKVEPSTT